MRKTTQGSSASVLADMAGFDEPEKRVATGDYLERGRRYES